MAKLNYLCACLNLVCNRGSYSVSMTYTGPWICKLFMQITKLNAKLRVITFASYIYI